MKTKFQICLTILLISIVLLVKAFATSNYEYKPGEYVRISNGLSPNAQYYIAAHGDGELGYDQWHLYFMDAHTGKVIHQLPYPPTAPLDTAAEAYTAEWSKDSVWVRITYRVDRHNEVRTIYKIQALQVEAKWISTRTYFPDSIVPIQ